MVTTDHHKKKKTKNQKCKKRESRYYTNKRLWKSYIWTADKDVNESDPRSHVYYLGSSENKAWKKKKKSC